MVLLFEDNEHTPSSELLKACLYGKSIHFSNGNHNLASKADELVNMGNSVIIFVDLSINCAETKLVYNTLSKKFRTSEHVLVLPIICIEYYILKMLYNHGFLNFPKYENDSTIQNLIHNFVIEITGEKIDKSLEKQYKSILNKIGDKKHCYINKNVKQKGKFYKYSCPCDNEHCKEYKTASLEYKAECLYSTLPVGVIDDKYKEYITNLGLDLEINSTNLQVVYNKLVDLHSKLHKMYGIGNMPLFKFNYNFNL